MHLTYRHGFTAWLDPSTSNAGYLSVPHAYHIFRLNGRVHAEYKWLAAMPEWDRAHAWPLFPGEPLEAPPTLVTLRVQSPRDWNEVVTKAAVQNLMASPMVGMNEDEKAEWCEVWKEAAHDYAADPGGHPLKLPPPVVAQPAAAARAPRAHVGDQYVAGEPLVFNENVPKSSVPGPRKRKMWRKAGAELDDSPYGVGEIILLELEKNDKWKFQFGVAQVQSQKDHDLVVHWFDLATNSRDPNGKWYPGVIRKAKKGRNRYVLLVHHDFGIRIACAGPVDRHGQRRVCHCPPLRTDESRPFERPHGEANSPLQGAHRLRAELLRPQAGASRLT